MKIFFFFQVPLKAFEFAIKQCEKYMRFKENEDLSVMDEPKVLQEEWNTFLQWFYTIANDHGKLQEGSSAQLMVLNYINLLNRFYFIYY